MNAKIIDKKSICINSLEKIKSLDKNWKDLDFIITTKEQLINISFEIYNQIKNAK